MLEKELDRVYIKSLNPNKHNYMAADVDHLKNVADRELENARKQYEIWIVNKKKLEKEVKETSDTSETFKLEEKVKKLQNKKKDLSKQLIELKYNSQHIGKKLKNAEHDPEDPNEIDNLMYKLKAIK